MKNSFSLFYLKIARIWIKGNILIYEFMLSDDCMLYSLYDCNVSFITNLIGCTSVPYRVKVWR